MLRLRKPRAKDLEHQPGPVLAFEWMGILWSRGLVGHPNLNVRVSQITLQKSPFSLPKECRVVVHCNF